MDYEQLLAVMSHLMDEKIAPINSHLDKIEKRLDRVEDRLEAMETRMHSMEGRMDRLESDVSSLKSGMLETRKELHVVSQKVDDTYQLALDAWGSSSENRKWLETMSV